MSKPTEAGDGAVFVHEIRVRWGDCDPAKIAYTGTLPALALEAIEAWWEAATGLDWYRLNVDRRLGTPFVALSLDFRSPVTPRFPLICEVRLERLGRTSVTHKVHARQDGKLCFEGEFTSVVVDAATMTPRTPPDDILRGIEALAGLPARP